MKLDPAKCQDRFAILRKTAKHSLLQLTNSHTIHFWDGEPVAVQTGDCIWHHAPAEPAVTKMINSLEPVNAPRIRASAPEFDFTVGQVLTLAGLPLTKVDK